MSTLIEIIDEAERKGFTKEELAFVKELYDNACKHYYQRIYKPHNEEMRFYAAGVCRSYMTEQIDKWHKSQPDGVRE